MHVTQHTSMHVSINGEIRGLGLGFQLIFFTRQLLSLPDGGVLALDWAELDPHHERPDTPVLLVMPGLTGQQKYGRNMICNVICVFHDRL